MQFIGTARDEVRDILVAITVLTVAFLLLDIVSYGRTSFVDYFWLFLPGALLAVLTAFLLHELAHRYTARRFGQHAFFKLWPLGALLALVTSLFGIIFAAPGAVYYGGYTSNREINGKISLAGPATNVIIGSAMAIAGLQIAASGAGLILLQVARLNFWFGLFNMIPIWQLDGAKVLAWNHEVFLVVIAVALFGTVLLPY